MKSSLLLKLGIALLCCTCQWKLGLSDNYDDRSLETVLKTLRPWRSRPAPTTRLPDRSRAALAIPRDTNQASPGYAINLPSAQTKRPSHLMTLPTPSSLYSEFADEHKFAAPGAPSTKKPSSNSESESAAGHFAVTSATVHQTPFTRDPGLGGPQPNLRGANNKSAPKDRDVSRDFSGYQSEPCGGNVTLSSIPKVIRSPGWEEKVKYPASADCLWTLKTNWDPADGVPTIKFRILHLELEDEVTCTYDYVDIRGHNRKLCGVIKDKDITINATEAVVHFKSDTNYEGRGFEIEISISIDGCLSKINAGEETGVITSPMHPQNYPDSIDCWTHISATESVAGESENVTITLSFAFIDMEPDEKCAYDYIEVYDGFEVGSAKPGPLLGKFCEWNVKEAELPERASTEVTSAESARTSTTTAGPPPALVVRSNGKDLLVHFHSDQLLNSRGYRATYVVDKLERSRGSNCKWAPNSDNLTINSPYYPQDYPSNADCTAVLVAPSPEFKIALIFESFYMEVDANCTFDRLEIYDEPHTSAEVSTSASESKARISGGSLGTKVDLRLPLVEPAKVLCGRKLGKFKFLSQGPQIRLRLVSDNYAEFPGFAARYTFIRDTSAGKTASSPSHEASSFMAGRNFELSPMNETVVSGSSHLINCKPRINGQNVSVEHFENKTVTWIKDDKVITEGLYEAGTKLLIKEFSSSSAGRYICKFGNLSREAWLSSKPPSCSLLFRKRPRDLVLSEGEYAILECNAVTTPSGKKVNIHWEKDGQRIQEQDGNATKTEQLQNGYLILNGIQSEDSGYYFCVASVEGEPECLLSAGAKLTVNHRINVDKICGQPVLGQPSRQKPSVDDYGKIVGGQDAQRGAFPWQVMFWDYKRRSFCGGALLNERWVLTAAHCFDSSKDTSAQPPPVEVRLGRYDQTAVAEDSQHITKIAEVIRHPDFNKETFDNDLALVRLEDHIPFSDFVKPICLGTDKEATEETFFRHHTLRMGHVTGWGQLKENGPQPKFLQELRMPIVPQAQCKSSTQFQVTPNMFCAGYAQEIVGDACKGDSGGPFVARSPDDQRWNLLGIVSWGEGCGRSGKYGFYTKVSNYIGWVKAFIKL